MAQYRSTYERYKNNPMKFVRELFSDANSCYDDFKRRIRRAMKHAVNTSAHIEAREADPEVRSAFYVPILRHNVSAVVDVQMDILRRGSPKFKAFAAKPEGLPHDLLSAFDKAANILEQYVNRVSRYDQAAYLDEMELLFESTVLFPYGVMRETPGYSYSLQPIAYDMQEVFNEYQVPVGYKYKPVYDERLKFVFPRIENVAPWQCRIDLQPRRWRTGWRYFFFFEDLTPDALISEIRRLGGDEANLRNILETSPGERPERDETYPSKTPSTKGNKYSTYRLVTGYIRMYNDERGAQETRVVRFVEEANDEFALLDEHLYLGSPSDPPFLITANYLLPGEIAGLSEVDINCGLADMGNEFWNLAADISRMAFDAPTIVADKGWTSRLSRRPYSKWRIDLERANLQGVQQAAQQLHTPNFSAPVFQMFGASEERVSGGTGGIDVISGQSYSRERKSNTLGRDQMRLEASARKITRFTIRHVERFEQLLNTGISNTRRQQLPELDENDMQYISFEVQGLSELDESIDIHIEMPHVKSFIHKEEEFDKIMGMSKALFETVPYFINDRPAGTLELARRMFEAADIPNYDAILKNENDERMIAARAMAEDMAAEQAQIQENANVENERKNIR